MSAEVLPKGASVEWQATHQTLVEPEDVDSDDEVEIALDLHLKPIQWGHRRSCEYFD